MNMSLKPQVYFGFPKSDVKPREQLQMMAGDMLPKEAVIWFAYRQHIQTAKNEYKYGLICYYEFKNRFYGIMAGRVSIGGEFLPWKRENFMFSADNTDPKWRLETEFERAKAAMDKHRSETGTTEASIFEDVLERMLEREKQWHLEENASQKP